jgi:hypothetical protein
MNSEEPSRAKNLHHKRNLKPAKPIMGSNRVCKLNKHNSIEPMHMEFPSEHFA